jgi:hypothetical protein
MKGLTYGVSFEGSLLNDGSQLNLREESESTVASQCHLYIGNGLFAIIGRQSVNIKSRNFSCVRNWRRHRKAGGNRDPSL